MTTDAPTRYPLAWPARRPRTKSRRYGQFRYDKRPITVAAAVRRLNAEVERLGAVYPLLSTDYPTRLDGGLAVGRGAPADPGVCLYFQLKGKPFALACDTFTEAPQNIAALAAHLEATRAIERYGVASAAETLEAFSALPPPSDTAPRARPWWQVLGFAAESALEHVPADIRAQVITTAYRSRARDLAAGGSHEAMVGLNLARDEALKLLGPKAIAS